VAQIISAFVTLSAALIIAFTFGWKLAMILVIGVPIIAGAAYKQLMIVQKSHKRDLECMDEAVRVRTLAIIHFDLSTKQRSIFYLLILYT